MELGLPILFTWITSIILACMIDGNRHGGGGCGIGFLLALLFGPLGLFATAFLDYRERCTNCGTKINGQARHCPACNETLYFTKIGQAISKAEYDRLLAQKKLDDEAGKTEV